MDAAMIAALLVLAPVAIGALWMLLRRDESGTIHVWSQMLDDDGRTVYALANEYGAAQRDAIARGRAEVLELKHSGDLLEAERIHEIWAAYEAGTRQERRKFSLLRRMLSAITTEKEAI